MEIHERIFALLGDERSMQHKMSKCIGVSAKTISAWKTRGSDPSAKLIPAIAGFLNVSVHYLLTGEEDPAHKKTVDIDDPDLRWMTGVLAEILSDPDPRRRTWAIIQFEDAFRDYCHLWKEKKIRA